MAYTERNRQILEYLKDRKSASVEELAKFLYVSEATVRRDLTELQKLGQVERSHGGAIIVEGVDEISIFIRQAKNAKEKERTASVALKHIPDFQTVFIDNSSTCLALAERMNFAFKTVVTYGLQIALRLSARNNITLIMPGGEIKSNTTATMGAMTVKAIEDMRFDLCLLSCAALDKTGAFEFSLESKQIKRAAFDNSKNRLLIVDRTKLGDSTTFRTATPDAYTAIITNADDDALAGIRESGAVVYNS